VEAGSEIAEKVKALAERLDGENWGTGARRLPGPAPLPHRMAG